MWYWKRFEEWAIDLRNKYKGNIFFRTEFNVIALQIAFAIILSVFVAISFNYFYKDILQTVLDGLVAGIKKGGNVNVTDIVNAVQIVKANNFFSFFAITLAITLLFSYIIAKITLTPTRGAFSSQKRFVSDIAHELRTPLSIIKTNSEVLLLDNSVDSQTKKIFKNNIEELDRASAIINNLLTVSNIIHPEQIQFSLVNMGEVVGSTVKKLDELVKKKEIQLVVKRISPSTVWGNTVALEQVVLNLVKNAVNYNRVGGIVTVKVEPDYHGHIVLSVEDNGVGISQKDLLHIFEPFYRAEQSRNRQSGSSGLGLTIVSELVNLHAGRISIRSHLKHGTVVTVFLPYRKSAAAGDPKDQTLDGEIFINFAKKKGKQA